MDKYRFNKLLEKIRNNDNSGLEPIYYEYYGKITYSAMQIVQNYSGAMDIASDIFLYILENVNYIGYIEYPNSWMQKLAKNFAIDFVRRNSRLILTDDFSQIANNENSNVATQACLYLEITSEVKKLSEHKQDLFELHYIYGYKYNEISKMLNIPVGTIKRQFHEIKAELHNLKKYL